MSAVNTDFDPVLLDELLALGNDCLNLDNADAKPLLDRIANAAKQVAGAATAANRGTHTHSLSEDNDNNIDWLGRAAAGVNLGIPVEAQAALVEAWDELVAVNQLEILAVEAKCVDDLWRLAGTLDRVARLLVDLKFVMDGGEIVVVPAGTVLILDVKTGQLRTNRGHPIYWHGYAIQLASYAQSIGYDTATDERVPWPWPIDQKWAIIAHLDVAAAIDGEAVARLVLVDLEAGRNAGNLVMAAKEWEKRVDVFSVVDSGGTATVTIPVEYPAATETALQVASREVTEQQDALVASQNSTENGTVFPGFAVDDGDTIVTYAELRAEQYVELAHMIATWPDHVRIALARTWPDPTVLPTPGQVRNGEACWTDTDMPMLTTLLNLAEAPFNIYTNPPATPVTERAFLDQPAPHTGREPVASSDLNLLLDTIAASGDLDTINRWLAEGHAAGVAWSPRKEQNVRCYEITRAALAAAKTMGDSDDVTLALINDAVTDAHWQPATHPVGLALGSLSPAEAQQVVDAAESFDNGGYSLMFDVHGVPILTRNQT